MKGMGNMPLAHRDISWLSFNHRVLQEAADSHVPLFERIKFLAIYSSNLDEFFRVRVAHHRNLMRAGKKAKKQLEFSPKEVAYEILEEVNKQQEQFSQIFEKEIKVELQKHNINILTRLQLTNKQKKFIEDYFNDNLLPFVQPVLLVKGMIRPFLNNAALYLSVHLKRKDDPKGSSEYAIVKVPSDYSPRFIALPAEHNGHDLIILDDIVRHNVSMLFPGYDIIDTYSIKLTRDADLYLEDEFKGDLIQKIKASLNKRNVGPASRFVYDRTMPHELLKYLMSTFDVKKADLLKEGRYHNNFDFFKFPDFGMNHLKNQEFPPLPYTPLEQADDIFKAIENKEHLIHVPYQSYESVIRFFEDAAKNPDVTHIKIVQYRVANKSRIMNALINAVKAGKQVMVFVEVKARFDEEANLRWGEKLEQAGVKVYYSFPGLKVHSKLGLVRKMEEGEEKFYSYLATGNFHEGTARVYSDFGLFTTDPRLTNEVARVFNFLETVHIPTYSFEHLLVGQFNLRHALVNKIEREIKNAKAGKKAKMVLKMNSLEDKEMIALLYKASRAGVHINMIVRGICCLVPGVKGYSENIEVISIVDRYLEHARIFWFYNEGNDEIYLSSADFMRRNLSYRVETAFPIYNEDLKEELRSFLRLQLLDNVKARVINAEMSNEYYQSSSDFPVQSQVETYYELKRKQGIN